MLTVNPGSSSVKIAVVDDRDRAVMSRTNGAEDGSIDAPGLRCLLADAPHIDGSAVRLVHGGEMVRSPTLVDASLASQLSVLADLAPLHNTAAIRALEVLRDVMPETPIVLCVDSAFHATIPEAAATYAIPWEWTQRHGFRKYGFHGLNHRYASRRAASLLERPVESLRLVTCHLGAGASLAAIAGGLSVDTTTGMVGPASRSTSWSIASSRPSVR